MSFVVAPECLALGLRAGAVVFRGARVGPAPEELRAEIAREVEKVRSEFAGPDAKVHAAGPDGVRRSFTLGELLPAQFGRGQLPDE